MAPAPANLGKLPMIRSIQIERFRCFRSLEARDWARVNVVVGDNGAGKTSLLEAIFFALGASSELGVRFRQQRGLEGSFAGQTRRIEEALWKDLFFQQDWSVPLSVTLSGDGPEARSVSVFRSAPHLSLPISDSPALPFSEAVTEQRTGSVTFVWTDANGREHVVKPVVTKGRIEFPATEEEVPDFFYYPSGLQLSSTEVAQRFSDMRRAGGLPLFERAFVDAFPWISDVQVEVVANAPVLYATDSLRKIRLPLALMSGAVTRLTSILLSMASRQDGVILVDELENGVFYGKHVAMWRALLAFAREYNTQLFTTTHSREWLEALVQAAGDDVGDLALWRLERNGGEQPDLFHFGGHKLKSGIEYGAEVRGEGNA